MTLRKSVSLLLATAFAVSLAACASSPLQKEVEAQLPEDSTAYLQVNLWPRRGRYIDWVNYHTGQLLPVNTAVTIEDLSDDELVLKVSGTGQKLQLINKERHSKLDAYGWAKRLLAPTKRDLSAFTADEQDAIAKGEVRKGMSRDAVLAAYGYPPAHRTDLESNVWTYWVTRRHTRVVTFAGDGKVDNVFEE